MAPRQTPPVTTGKTLKLNVEQLDRIATSLGWQNDSQIARAIGCDPVHVWRVKNGLRAPGPRFVAGLLAAIKPWQFDHVFEVVPDERPAA